MTLRTASAGLFVVGVAVGTLADRTPPKAPLVRGGYQVLAVDLHVHSFLGDGVLLPWDLAREAGRRGLDAFAITNHSQVLVAKVGRWLSRFTGGPTILVGEEVTAPGYHLIAVGIEEKVSWRQPVARAIEDVHAQGGVAIAAHPLARFWPAFDAAALRSLDGAEVMHPVAYSGPEKAEELRAF
jgi:predicted metal-dependent phosphoesterase TrpH